MTNKSIKNSLTKPKQLRVHWAFFNKQVSLSDCTKLHLIKVQLQLHFPDDTNLLYANKSMKKVKKHINHDLSLSLSLSLCLSVSLSLCLSVSLSLSNIFDGTEVWYQNENQSLAVNDQSSCVKTLRYLKYLNLSDRLIFLYRSFSRNLIEALS